MASRRATGGPGRPRQPLKYQRAALAATEAMQRAGVIPEAARGRSPPRHEVDDEEQYDSQDDSRASTAHSDEHDAYAIYSDRSAAGGMRPLSPRAAGMVPLPSSTSLDDRRSATGTEASDAALDRDQADSDVDDGLGTARSDRRHARGAERAEEASRQCLCSRRHARSRTSPPADLATATHPAARRCVAGSPGAGHPAGDAARGCGHASGAA